MNVAGVAAAVFTLGIIIGTMLGYLITEKRASLERIRTLARANPDWTKNAVSMALPFSKSYLDFIFGPRSFSPRAFVICIGVSLVTTLLILGAMLHNGISQRFVGWAVLFGIIDMLALFVTRRVVNTAVSGRWRGPLILRLLLTMALITVVAYFAMGLAWCTYFIVVQLYEGHVPDPFFLLITLVYWLPGLVITHNADIIPATIPGAFNTIVLLVIIGLPALFLSTARISKPLFMKALDVLLEIPRWSGIAIVVVCMILSYLCSVALKP